MEKVKVLHPPRDVIPLGPVGDPLPEVIPLADVAPVQRDVVVSVGVGQLLEQGVIRSSGHSALIKRVAGDNRATVEVGQDNEGVGDYPGHHGQGLGLTAQSPGDTGKFGRWCG